MVCLTYKRRVLFDRFPSTPVIRVLGPTGRSVFLRRNLDVILPGVYRGVVDVGYSCSWFVEGPSRVVKCLRNSVTERMGAGRRYGNTEYSGVWFEVGSGVGVIGPDSWRH